MKPPELLDLLTTFHRDKLALRMHHEAAARQIPQYAFNNTYQYIINREDLHLDWVRRTIEELGGSAPAETAAADAPAGTPGEPDVFRGDLDAMNAFVERWRPRIDTVSPAKYRSLLRVVLGEMLEQRRFFEQALAGRKDLLGRSTDGSGARGEVMSTRWVE